MNLFTSRTNIEPNTDDYLVQDLVVDSQTTNHAIKKFCQQIVLLSWRNEKRIDHVSIRQTLREDCDSLLLSGYR
jgi:hypothetical protein